MYIKTISLAKKYNYISIQITTISTIITSIDLTFSLIYAII